MDGLPTETKQQIYQYLSADDLRAIRLTNKQNSAIACRSLFHTVTIYPFLFYFDWLILLSQNPNIKHCIKTVQYAPAVLPKINTYAEYKASFDFKLSSWIYRLEHFYHLPLEPYQLWLNYEACYSSQLQKLDGNQLLMLLVRAFRGLPNLREIIFLRERSSVTESGKSRRLREHTMVAPRPGIYPQRYSIEPSAEAHHAPEAVTTGRVLRNMLVACNTVGLQLKRLEVQQLLLDWDDPFKNIIEPQTSQTRMLTTLSTVSQASIAFRRSPRWDQHFTLPDIFADFTLQKCWMAKLVSSLERVTTLSLDFTNFSVEEHKHVRFGWFTSSGPTSSAPLHFRHLEALTLTNILTEQSLLQDFLTCHIPTLRTLQLRNVGMIPASANNNPPVDLASQMHAWNAFHRHLRQNLSLERYNILEDVLNADVHNTRRVLDSENDPFTNMMRKFIGKWVTKIGA